MAQANRIGWAILGTGQMAGTFAATLQGLDDVELAAVGSRKQDSANAFGQRHACTRCYGSYTEVLHDPAVEVVYIATPHASHAELATQCLHAGKAVLCEKAFTLNAAQAAKVIGLARDKQLFLMEAMWTRFVPAVVKLRELLQQQAIGDIQLMLAGGAYMPEFDPDYYLFNRDLGGGILLDAGVYLVSMASMVFGKPQRVLATGELGPTGVDEHEAILLSHARGEIANLYVSHRAKSSPDLTLMGSKGKIYLHPPVFCPSALTLSVDGRADEVFDFAEPGSGYRYQVMEVNQCLRAGRTESKLMPLDETLAVMGTLDEIRKQLGVSYPADRSPSG